MDRPRLAKETDISSVLQLMIDRGWCPHQVYALAQMCDHDTFCGLADIVPYPPRQADHTICSEQDQCVAYNVDMDNYRTRHVRGDCQCEMITVPKTQLLETVSNGQVPLIRIESRGDVENQRIDLTVHQRDEPSQYVAVSHIWADGLGNPAANALPTCQLERLQCLLRTILKTDNEVLFWLDTLCVPVSDEALRRRAIIDMASIYAGCREVLVLDAGLMKATTCCTTAARAQVLTSIWMTRSWALQEGMLAEKCSFLFADKVFMVWPGSKDVNFYRRHRVKLRRIPQKDLQLGGDHLHKTLQNHTRLSSTTDHNQHFADNKLAKAVNKLYSIQKCSKKSEYQCFKHAWNGLIGRSTTKGEDVHIILSNLLGRRSRNLWGLKPHECLPALLFSLQTIPFSFFFANSPRKWTRQFPRNGWVPTATRWHYPVHGPALINELDGPTSGTGRLKVNSGQIRRKFHVLFFTAHAAMKSSPVLIHSRDLTTAFQLQFLGAPVHALGRIGSGSIFIIIPKSSPAVGNPRAAVFHSSSAMSWHKMTAELEWTFVDSVSVTSQKTSLDRGVSREGELKVEVFDRDCAISILYDKMSHLPHLDRLPTVEEFENNYPAASYESWGKMKFPIHLHLVLLITLMLNGLPMVLLSSRAAQNNGHDVRAIVVGLLWLATTSVLFITLWARVQSVMQSLRRDARWKYVCSLMDRGISQSTLRHQSMYSQAHNKGRNTMWTWPWRRELAQHRYVDARETDALLPRTEEG